MGEIKKNNNNTYLKKGKIRKNMNKNYKLYEWGCSDLMHLIKIKTQSNSSKKWWSYDSVTECEHFKKKPN